MASQRGSVSGQAYVLVLRGGHDCSRKPGSGRFAITQRDKNARPAADDVGASRLGGGNGGRAFRAGLQPDVFDAERQGWATIFSVTAGGVMIDTASMSPGTAARFG